MKTIRYVVFILLGLCGCENEPDSNKKIEDYRDAKPILQNIKFILDNNAALNEDLYKNKNLEKIFGRSDISRTKGPYLKFITFRHYHKEPTVPNEGIKMGSGEFDITIAQKTQDEKLIDVVILMSNLQGTYAGIGYKEIEKIFGKSWENDSVAEDQRIHELTRELWSPPLPKKTSDMGYKVMKYVFETPVATNIASFWLEYDGSLLHAEFEQLIK